MTRCRDTIIERSKWLCSVALMSAAGAAVFGVAGADGRGGSHWAEAHSAPAHTRTVALASGFGSHVTAVRSHRISFSSHVAPVQSHAVSATHAVSAAAQPATTHHAAAPHTAATHQAASTHATKRIRVATNDNFDSTDTSTAGAASGTLGALAGSDTQVTTCPADGSTPTTSAGDTSTTQSTDTSGSDTCSNDSSSGDTGSAPTTTTTGPTDTTTNPTGTTTDPTGNTSTTNNGQDNTTPGDNGSGTDTSGSGTDTSGSGTDTSGSGTDSSGSGTDGSGSGTDTSGSGTTGICDTQPSSGDGSQSTDSSGSNGTTDQLPETNPGVVCPGGSATPGAAGGSTSGSGSSTSSGSGSTGTPSTSITAQTNGSTIGSSNIPPTTVTPLPTPGNAPSVSSPSTSTSTPPSNNNSSTGFSSGAPTLTSSGAAANLGTGAGRTGATAGASLGGINPAATALGLAGGGTSTGTGTGTGAGSHSTSSQHKHSSHGITDPISTVPVAAQALVKFVNHIPAWLWIALAALATVAAVSLGVAFRNGRRVRAQASAIAEVSAAALTDPLTGVLNRRGFTEAMERELARARRYGRPFVLAYVDVRGLKAVNDTEGHLAGDELLKGVAGLLHDSARADDVVGRLGGDELGLLLAEQTADHAEVVTDRIQSQIPERRAELGLATPWGLTIGTAAFPEDGETFNELLATADRRLYEQRGIELRRDAAPRV
jgi:diguanylate cyclase (GGDEF)-like protein